MPRLADLSTLNAPQEERTNTQQEDVHGILPPKTNSYYNNNFKKDVSKQNCTSILIYLYNINNIFYTYILIINNITILTKKQYLILI